MQHHLPLPTLLNARCLFKLSICPLFTEMCRALLAFGSESASKGTSWSSSVSLSAAAISRLHSAKSS